MESYISNAGLVLLNPFLPRLFDMLSLTQIGQFKDTNSKVRAVLITQYAVSGNTEFVEYEFKLNKLLVGLDDGTPIPLSIDITLQEIETVNGLLNAVTQNWSKLRNTSTEVLRESFLIRQGKLEERDDFYQLTVEEKGYDVLLTSLPWSFSTIKFSWMEKELQVKWR